MNAETLYEAGFRARLKGTKLVFPTGYWRHPKTQAFHKGDGTMATPAETLDIIEAFIPDIRFLPPREMYDEIKKTVLQLAHIHKERNHTK